MTDVMTTSDILIIYCWQTARRV